MTPVGLHIPVTLALACALEDAGDIFAAAEALVQSGLAGTRCAPLGRLLCDVIAPLQEMGGICTDDVGKKHIDRQAICDFGIVACGLSRQTVMYELTLHELALHHRRVMSRSKNGSAPSVDFLTDMQQLFPDEKGLTV